MKTDLDTIRSILEKLEIEYSTRKKGEITIISIRDTPKISFSFFLNGEICSLYNEW